MRPDILPTSLPNDQFTTYYKQEREEYMTKIRDLLARDSEQEAVRKLRVVMLYYSNYFDPTALKVLTTRQDS